MEEQCVLQYDKRNYETNMNFSKRGESKCAFGEVFPFPEFSGSVVWGSLLFTMSSANRNQHKTDTLFEKKKKKNP